MNTKDILNDKKIFKSILKIRFRECAVGEYNNKIRQVCHKCPVGEFSFNTENKCQKCSNEFRFQECFGGARTSLRNGYWRHSNSSREIYKCNN